MLTVKKDHHINRLEVLIGEGDFSFETVVIEPGSQVYLVQKQALSDNIGIL
jgi:hypothetical protein